MLYSVYTREWSHYMRASLNPTHLGTKEKPSNTAEASQGHYKYTVAEWEGSSLQQYP